MLTLPSTSPLFPYTTLFRSVEIPIRSSVATSEVLRPSRSPKWPKIAAPTDRKSTRLNSSHQIISYAVFWLKKNKEITTERNPPNDACNTKETQTALEILRVD